MKHNIIAIRDRKANAFNRPMALPSIGQAIRSFQDEINREDNNNDLWKHPGDFDLYLLGTWDDETGQFENSEVPNQIAIGEELKYRI